MRPINLCLIRWLTGCLIFFLCACNGQKRPLNDAVYTEDSAALKALYQRAWDSLRMIRQVIRHGDLITRTGNDFTSETFRKTCRRDKTYSHCGIISIENDSAFVYHSLGGEWNPDQKILRDPLSRFAEPYGNKGIGIFRMNTSQHYINEIVKQAAEWFRRQIRFDMSFSLESDDRMYCAEFVAKAVQQATKNEIRFDPSYLGDVAFFGTDDIFLHPKCTEIRRLVYK